MNQPASSLQSFQFNNFALELWIPNAQPLQDWYQAQLKNDPEYPSPYWAQIWPAAYALCEFIAEHPQFIHNKRVVELAAGLGLPSFLSAQIAKEVICSDYDPVAVETMYASIAEQGLENCKAYLLDWNNLPPTLQTDVLLLSDINYEPAAFAQLKKVIEHFLDQNTIILLSTPQRLMAKPFIEELIPFTVYQEEFIIQRTEPATICSVLVLKK